MVDSKRFEGKVAIVTGAGRGMGRATVVRLAREGAAVVVNDVNQGDAEAVAEAVRAEGGRALAHVADVARESDVQNLVGAAVEAYGRVDILVNNAGILRKTMPLETISLDEWQRVLAVNLTGVFLCTRAVLPIMKEQKSGKIVNVSSSAGRTTSTFGGAHYTTSKAAVLGLTRHTAREAAPFGVNVNAVTPGSMDTEMVRELATPEHIEHERRNIPLGRLGTAEDEAALVAFLCSEDAAYVTGATVDINGGDLMM